MEDIDKIYDLLNSIKVTRKNEIYIKEIKALLATGNYFEALKKMRELKDQEDEAEKNKIKEQIEKLEQTNINEKQQKIIDKINKELDF